MFGWQQSFAIAIHRLYLAYDQSLAFNRITQPIQTNKVERRKKSKGDTPTRCLSVERLFRNAKVALDIAKFCLVQFYRYPTLEILFGAHSFA